MFRKLTAIFARLSRPGKQMGDVPVIHQSSDGVAPSDTSAPASFPKSDDCLSLVENEESSFPEVAIVKTPTTIRGEFALIVAQTATGSLKPNVAPLVEQLALAGVATLVVAMVQRPVAFDDTLLASTAGAVAIRDVGGPFHGWALATALFPDLYGCDRLYLLSDTLVPATKGDRFAKFVGVVGQCSDDLQALSASFVNDWHLQPHFIAIGSPLIAAPELEEFFAGVLRDGREGRSESHRFAWEMETSGHRAKLLFQPDTGLDPTIHGWQDMLRAGCPLVRGSVLLDGSEQGIVGRLEALEGEGFDLDLLERVVRWESEIPSGHAEARLLARPVVPSRQEGALAITCFASWNVESPDGDLARALVVAFRRAGHRINLLPSGLPSASSNIAPPIAMRDFLEPPQLAIMVGMAGDPPEMLPAEQRHVFATAPHRAVAWTGALSERRPAWIAGLAGVGQLWSDTNTTLELVSGAADVITEIMPSVHGTSLLEWDAFVVRAVANLEATSSEQRVGLPMQASAGIPVENRGLAEGVDLIALERDGEVTAALEYASVAAAEWIILAPEGAFLAPAIAKRLLVHAELRPEVALFYADDVAGITEEPNDQVRLKPEFDQTLLASQDYIGFPILVRTQALRAVGGLTSNSGTAAMLDLVSRVHDAGLPIARIPEVLMAWIGERVFAAPADRVAVLKRYLRDDVAVLPGRVPGALALRQTFRPDEQPAVTIIVPTCRALKKDGETYIERLLVGLRSTEWQMNKLTILIGDDNPDRPEWADADWPFRLEWHATPRAEDAPFNYAQKMNYLWRLAEDEQIVLINDDVLPTSGGWLAALQTYALDPGVGGVGGRLTYQDGRLQHAGMTPHAGGIGHVWLGRKRLGGTYQGWAMVAREWSMVTGALFATRRSLLGLVGGFDEDLRLEYNDADLCLRLRAAGYRIVYTPDAELVHAEKSSRGDSPAPGSDRARFMRRWHEWIAEDPSWHPGLEPRNRTMTPRVDPNAWYF